MSEGAEGEFGQLLAHICSFSGIALILDKEWRSQVLASCKTVIEHNHPLSRARFVQHSSLLALTSTKNDEIYVLCC